MVSFGRSMILLLRICLLIMKFYYDSNITRGSDLYYIVHLFDLHGIKRLLSIIRREQQFISNRSPTMKEPRLYLKRKHIVFDQSRVLLILVEAIHTI